MSERPHSARPWPRKVLMLVTDRKRCTRRSLAECVADAIEGGVNVVQLREKDLPAGELLQLARQLRGVCGTRTLLIVNDRLDVALLSGADGVHLGSKSLPVAAARQFLPPSMRVGRSVHSVNEARQADLDGADYVLAGTVFPSASHADAVPAGTSFLRDLTARVGVPVVAIGGINPGNVAHCWETGVEGVAAISSILDTEDPREAAARLLPPMEEEPACASS